VKDRQSFGWDEDPDVAGGTKDPQDGVGAFEGEDHLVDGERGDAEKASHVGFGGQPGIDIGIVVNACQALLLLGREGQFGVGLLHRDGLRVVGALSVEEIWMTVRFSCT
jgi:hypothetical protein